MDSIDEMTDGPTPFIEANAILAAQERDSVEVMRLLAKLTPPERRTLYHGCEFLLDILDQVGFGS